MDKKAQILTQNDLDNFTGTTKWYKHALSKYLYTDGVKYLAEIGQAYWLIDKILITTRSKTRLQDWGTWILRVNEDKTSLLECGDGNGKTLYKTEIDHTDFPLAEIKLFFTNNTLLLPSEY